MMIAVFRLEWHSRLMMHHEARETRWWQFLNYVAEREPRNLVSYWGASAFIYHYRRKQEIHSNAIMRICDGIKLDD